MPKFSVIVPLYNKAHYVKKALDSIVSQSFKDWECIIVDDGSTDGSLDVVRDFVRNDGMSRLRLNEPLTLDDGRLTILSQLNAGVAAARNNGGAQSHGEYLCFLDADDWWEPTYLEEMDRLINEYPDAGLFATNYVYYKPGKTHVALHLDRGYMNYPVAYMHGEMPVWTGATCMPRRVFDEMEGFPLGIKLGEDFLLWAKTALYYKVAFCEKALAYYNNDVPASLRATRNLHAPQYHMLFHLDEIEHIINDQLPMTKTELIAPLRQRNDQSAAWHALLDKLRVSGLMNYWLSAEYHAVAAAELTKVDWTKQPQSAQARYQKPIWYLKAHRRLMHIGSYFKQKFIRLRYKK